MAKQAEGEKDKEAGEVFESAGAGAGKQKRETSETRKEGLG